MTKPPIPDVVLLGASLLSTKGDLHITRALAPGELGCLGRDPFRVMLLVALPPGYASSAPAAILAGVDGRLMGRVSFHPSDN